MNLVELPRVGVRNRSAFREPQYNTSLWVGIGAAVLGAGTAIYSADQQRKNVHATLDAQKRLNSDIAYEPIDIEALKADATRAAIENATNSLAIERSLMPDVADTRTELARQVNADLKLGGELPTDVINRVTQAGRIAGARSGNGSGTSAPLTASLLGLSSIDLLNSRRSAAEKLLSANELPMAGLSPGQIASVEIANNQAKNDFDSEKTGVDAKLIQAEGQARASQLAGQVGTAAALTNLLGTIGTTYGNYTDGRVGVGAKTTYDDFMKKNAPAPISYPTVQTSGFFQ